MTNVRLTLDLIVLSTKKCSFLWQYVVFHQLQCKKLEVSDQKLIVYKGMSCMICEQYLNQTVRERKLKYWQNFQQESCNKSMCSHVSLYGLVEVYSFWGGSKVSFWSLLVLWLMSNYFKDKSLRGSELDPWRRQCSASDIPQCTGMVNFHIPAPPPPSLVRLCFLPGDWAHLGTCPRLRFW